MARRPTPPGTPERTGVGHVADLVRNAIPPCIPPGFRSSPYRWRSPWRRQTQVGAPDGSAGRGGLCDVLPAPEPGAAESHRRRGRPADGEIALVDTAAPPAELGLGDQPLPRVSIFLSVLDVHVQRTPVSGVVRTVLHQPGQFRSADLPEASSVNERNSMVLETSNGQQVVVVQIAGLLARRIVCDAQVGDVLTIGDTYGLIRFGSRVDTYFPPGTELLVEPGQRTIGGETVLAVLASTES